jgi:adenylate cyclase
LEPASAIAPRSKLSKPSIAVMPFSNLSTDREQDYFAQGMAEEITTALSRYPGLFVVGVGAGHGAHPDTRGGEEIAGALGVRYLLEGTVRKAGERVRITVKLADAIDNIPVWSDRFDGALTDIFALQDEVAHAVAAQVVPNISAAEERRASSRPTADMTAYDLVLRVTPILRRNAPGATAEALALLEQAIALDPDYGRALALAAFAHSLAVAAGAADLGTSRPIGLDLAARALKSQRDDPETLAYAVLAEINFQADIWVGARMIERALEHYPGVAMLWHASGFANLRQGRAEVAQARFEEAMRLDPMDVDLAFNQIGLGMALVLQRRFEDALPPLAESVRLAPMTPVAAVYLAFALNRLARETEAKEVLAPYGRSVIVSYLQAQLTATLQQRDAGV